MNPFEFAKRLAGGSPVEEPVAIVVAHPDDETLWAGSALGRMRRLRLILLTDGAPFDMRDARRLGIADRATYAALRAGELDRALEALRAAPDRRFYAIPDQDTALRLPDLVERLVRGLAGVSAVITHPYEGGHPDHDSAAFAVRAAADRLAREEGAAPAIVEFACYHAIEGERHFGRFWLDEAHPERSRPIEADERDRIEAAIAAHASQAFIIGDWRPLAERWRAAPRYDFSRPPPPGEALYDQYGWAMTSSRWRELAAAAAGAMRS